MPASSDPFFKETIYQRTCKFWTLRDYKKNNTNFVSYCCLGWRNNFNLKEGFRVTYRNSGIMHERVAKVFFEYYTDIIFHILCNDR